MNRLANATSPYLLQHADNPVDWWPWGDEAFAEARRRDVPLFISVGYASCHWCHVMAHESFEDPAIAAVVNDSVVAVKVDREERPDVDAVYMAATQALTGQGGWPMTVFATPDGEPFYCGTYFPPDVFVQLVRAAARAWREQRADVLRRTAAVVAAIAKMQLPAGLAVPPEAGPAVPSEAGPAVPSEAGPAVPGAKPSAQPRTGPAVQVRVEPTALPSDVLDAAARSLYRDYDSRYGGFGSPGPSGQPGATGPKFPPHMAMLFLLRQYQRTGDERSLEIVRHTAEQMARGGLYDQLAGGFARYSVDPTWTVPHFEKMLYDNALLLRVYAHLWRLTGDPLAARVARETAAFLVRDMSTVDGGFASALDADTDGVEGATYVWTPATLREVLGPDDGAWAADLFGVTDAGTFEAGTSVLRLARDIDAADPPLVARWQRVRAVLWAARNQRPQPARDDKVVAAWNGLAVTALAEFILCGLADPPAAPVGAAPVGGPASTGTCNSPGAASTGARNLSGATSAGTPDASRLDLADVERALFAAAEALAERHWVDGRLRRVSRAGMVGEPVGVLDDYGAVAEGFLAMHQYTGAGRWLDLAGQLLDTALARFSDGASGWHDTADDAQRLVVRPADPTDNATPSGRSVIAAALTGYAALTGRRSYRTAAQAALAPIAPLATENARFVGYACAVGEALLSGPYQVAIAGESAGGELVRTAWRYAPPGAVIVSGPPDAPTVPLLANRPMLDGRPTGYVCREFVCELPVTSAAALADQLCAATRGRPPVH